MLQGLRILELSEPQTMLAGLMLADLGADVITVEPVAGAAGRRMGPFLSGRIGVERSLTWHALNRNKRGVTIDVHSVDGQDAFRRLAATADAVIESSPARFKDLGDQGLVHCAVRPFSVDGPKAGYAWTDRTIEAAAGVPQQTGDADRAPLMIPVPQAMMEAGAEAAIGVLAALAARARDGMGQKVDVSMRAAAMLSAFSLPYFAQSPERPPLRGKHRHAIAGVETPTVMPCQDGFVQVSIAFGGFGGITRNMAVWAVQQGTLDATIAEIDWSTFEANLGPHSGGQLAALVAGLQAAFGQRTKREIGDAAREYGFFAAPLMDMADISTFAQYRERGIWLRQPLIDGVEIDAPTQVMRTSGHEVTLRYPAPRLSEHTQSLLVEAGLSDAEVQALFHHQVI